MEIFQTVFNMRTTSPGRVLKWFCLEEKEAEKSLSLNAPNVIEGKRRQRREQTA